MQDLARIRQLGLRVYEIKMLGSIFLIAPKLKNVYQVVDAGSNEQADVYLINADDPDAMEKWGKISSNNSQLTPIMIGNQCVDDDAIVTLRRPVRMQKLVEALEAIVKKHTITNTPTNDTSLSRAFNIEENNKLRGLDILVVDDSYPVRKYMEQKLIELAMVPIRITFTASGEEALYMIKSNPFDMVFLDVIMEGMDGYQVCKRMKAGSDVYVVMLTSKKSPFDKVRGTMSGCNAYLTKPPDDVRLSKEISKCFQASSQSRKSVNF